MYGPLGSGAALKAVLSIVDPQVQTLQAVMPCRVTHCAWHQAQVAKALELATGLGQASGITVSAMATVER